MLRTGRSPCPLAASLAVLLVACGEGDGGAVVPLVPSSADPRENVLVIDDGFDTSAPVLTPQIAGQYTVTCVGADPVAIWPAPGTLEARRAAVLAALQVRDERCHVIPGIQPKPDPLANISTYRPAWNRIVENQLPAEGIFTSAQLIAIQRGLSRGQYHGTATASIIAQGNPGVRLVLVEMEIESDDEENRISCLDQGDLDRTVELFSDPEVQRAYVARPPSSLEAEMAALKQRHRIGLVNESFGYVSRERVEQVLGRLGCPPVMLRPFFALRGQLEERRAQAHPQPDSLLIKAAGNDGALVMDAEDLFVCAGSMAPRLLVASYDLTGALSGFSNRGLCIDVVAPGESVIAHYPAGWLMPLDGTSLAAPLMVRLISLDREGGPFSAAGARQAALAARDGTGRIPFARFPRTLFYDPDNASARWALVRR